MSLTQQDLPGIYVEFTMHANTDAKIQITLYSEYDEATGTGTVIDLTGASFKARAIDADGNELWSVVPTSAVPAPAAAMASPSKKEKMEGSAGASEPSIFWGPDSVQGRRAVYLLRRISSAVR